MTAPQKDWCPACRGPLMLPDQIERHNVSCSLTGERSYEAAVNVRSRTAKTGRMPQGAGAHSHGAYEQ